MKSLAIVYFRQLRRTDEGLYVATPRKVAVEKEEVAPRARLHKLTVSNFRCIGSQPVTIELDDIVVLVGPNNAGKSSLLRAYEVVMQSGKSGNLDLDDFPNGTTPSAASHDIPTIELETVLYPESRAPAEKWISIKENGDRHVREQWKWRQPGPPTKVGFNVETGDWDASHGPWGLASVAQVNRPEPHRIEAFDNPTKQADEIAGLLKEVISQKIKELTATKSEDGAGKSAYERLLDSVTALQREVAENASSAIDNVRTNLNESLASIFPGYAITLDAHAEDDVEKAITLFKSAPSVRMGPMDGYQSPLERQGSGARRTLLWTALRILAEHKRLPKNEGEAQSDRPHLLLLDEPEMCLHPNAIRDACNVLYQLPETRKWQVMLTTHSPVFIDLSRDNTSIVRVDRSETGSVTGTTIFRPTNAKLDARDKEELKLLNMYDPYVAEFFFGGRTIIVEGDTEHSAFMEIIQGNKERFHDVHVVRARGKYTIVALCKILNQFGKPYSVLHDADSPEITTKSGQKRKSSAWVANAKIKEAAMLASNGEAMVIASLPNFELAMFGEAADGEKPYGAWEKVRNESVCRDKVTQLLSVLAGLGGELPLGTLQWQDEPQLSKAVEDYENAIKLLKVTTQLEVAANAIAAVHKDDNQIAT